MCVSSIVTYVCYLLYIFISPPIYYYALSLLKPPLDQSGYASCYRRYRLDITLWYNRGLWLCTLCLCVQTYTISYPIHDHYYCMFYYVSMRLISTSINQWLLWFCLASLRSCYRNHILSGVILYLLTKVAMPVLHSMPVITDKWSHRKGATTYRIEWLRVDRFPICKIYS